MQNTNHSDIKTLKQLKNSRYKPRSIKDEMRENLIEQLIHGKNSFEGIIGYDQSVIPDIHNAILSRHSIILLGLRGQAKTRIARLMVNLLDEYIPIVKGSELNDDPFKPISRFAIDLINEKGDETPIDWIHRSIFVINELPDLQARIQVALFNILQEEDIQIRGFKIRLPLDLQFVFTANPEDYTNRGAIVTPLKDRIDSQILTHYPKSIQISKEITHQEAKLKEEQKNKICSSELVKNLIEQIAFEARESEYVDSKSGVSARLTISAYENLISNAEKRMLLNHEKETAVRISDFIGIIPSITGKIELVYEGEQEGSSKVAHILIGKAVRNQFTQHFPSPDKLKKNQESNPYQSIINWFGKGNEVDLLQNISNAEYKKQLHSVPGLKELINKYHPNEDEQNKLLLMEFALHGLAEYSLLSKFKLETGIQFKDMLSSMFSMSNKDEDDDDEYYRNERL
jgi:magnesium chelatase subunit I